MLYLCEGIRVAIYVPSLVSLFSPGASGILRPPLSPQGKCDTPFPTQLFREFWNLRPFPPLGKFHFLTHFSSKTAFTENLILASVFWSSCLIKCACRKTGPTSRLLSKLLPFPRGGFVPCTSRCLVLPRHP